MDEPGSDSREATLHDVVKRCRDTKTTALLVHSDPQAIELARYCNDHGVSVPDDLSIVAYDDEFAAHGDPPITALRPPKSRIGALAVQSLVTRLDAPEGHPVERIDLLPELIVRESSQPRGTRVPPGGD